jgi:hypothetical protein
MTYAEATRIAADTSLELRKMDERRPQLLKQREMALQVIARETNIDPAAPGPDDLSTPVEQAPWPRIVDGADQEAQSNGAGADVLQ